LKESDLMTEEQWRDIVIEKNGKTYDFTGYYEVSNYGKVRNIKTGRILKQTTTKDGYKKVQLQRSVDGVVNRNFRVHRLVATAFVPNPNNLPEVNHINHIRDCNIYTNLEWVTRQENIDDSSVCRKVICLETEQVFATVREAEKWLGKKGIYDCCRGKAKTIGGYHWQYYND
jgi:hypothetical protein